MSYQEYFHFNRREKRGIFVLSIIFVIVLLMPKISQLWQNDDIKNKEELLKEITDFQNSLVLKDQKDQKDQQYQSSVDKNYMEEKKAEKKEVYNIDSFNVNNSTVQDWMKLNFSRKQAKVIVNYLDKAKPLSNTHDLLKIYVIDEEKYSKIKPFIYINNDTIQLPSVHQSSVENYDLNLVDSLQLKSMGIPAYLASRIIRYRDLLGGFYAIHQLNEVFGIQDEHVKLLINSTIDTTLIIKINLNNSDFKTLNKHPYLSYEATKSILTYLKIMNKIKSGEELVKNKIVSSEELIKIKPYIAFED